jgi:hypothetical protein
MVNLIEPSESEQPEQKQSVKKVNWKSTKYFLQAEIKKYLLHWDFITSLVYTGFGFFGVPFRQVSM